MDYYPHTSPPLPFAMCPAMAFVFIAENNAVKGRE
jgi:hypothetical protein